MAQYRGTGIDPKDAQANRTGSDELEVAPFTFDFGPRVTGGNALGSDVGLPDMPLGQFGDAEMEFEPFMFDQGQVEQPSRQGASTATEVAPPGFSFESFLPVEPPTEMERAPGAVSTQTSPIVGGDLPLPSYLSGGQIEPSEPDDPASWVTEDPLMPAISSESSEATIGLVLPTAPTQPAVGTDTGSGGVSKGEQITGRTPTGPLPTAPSPGTYTQPAASPVTGLGRARGNTGPLGPLPPDRSATPNASWSDSSLASIEDFSSILIAMQAGKKLRQSGPLSESMIPQSSTATLEPQITPFSMAEGESTDFLPDTEDMPEWAMQAAQSAHAMQEMVHTVPTLESGTAGEQTTPDFLWGAEQPVADLPDNYSAATTAVEEAQWPVADQAQEATPTMIAPATESPQLATGATAEAAAAELAATREQATGSVPSNIEPEVAEALKNVSPMMAGGNLSGEDLQFEGFMFEQGSAPALSAQPGSATDEQADLFPDMGPMFDPTPYLQVVENESEEMGEYGDLDAAILTEMNASPGFVEAMPQAEDNNNTGDLPFWLQGTSNEAPTGLLIQDTAQRDWGTEEGFLSEPARPMPSEWVGEVTEAAPADLSAPSMEVATPEALDDNFGDLPPIEPFDFSLLPTNDVEEPLGFNTEELIGLNLDDPDPMTITVNLAAVADLLGGRDVSNAELMGSDTPTEMALSSADLTYEETAATQVGEQPQQAWDRPSIEADTDTVAGLDADMLSTGYGTSIDMPPMDLDSPEAGSMAESGFQVDRDVEMATPSLAASTESTYGVEIPEASEDAGYVAEVQPTATVERVDIPHATTIGEGHSTRGWMASATTNLTDTTLAGMTGEIDGMNTQPVEMDLAIDGVEVAPFDYEQLDLESEEQHTGQLELDQLQRGYGTGKLMIPDEADALQSRPLNDVWSEADGDASLFLPVPTDEEVTTASPQAGQDQEEESEPAIYMAEGNEPAGMEMEPSVEEYTAVPVEASIPGEAAPPVEEAWDMAAQAEVGQPAQETEIKARVASNRWMGYAEEQGKPGGEPVAQEAVMPASQDTLAGDAASAESAPAFWDASAQPETPSPTMQFEHVQLPARGDILSSGPLPPLEGYGDMNEWAMQNPQDVGAHLAMAAAYVQAEDVDTALRMYRKIIKMPGASPTVLSMIGDDLSDLEDMAKGLPRYYQVVGDLLLRLGRHKEAIEAYNKIR
jgi:hypothetical protein